MDYITSGNKPGTSNQQTLLMQHNQNLCFMKINKIHKDYIGSTKRKIMICETALFKAFQGRSVALLIPGHWKACDGLLFHPTPNQRILDYLVGFSCYQFSNKRVFSLKTLPPFTKGTQQTTY